MKALLPFYFRPLGYALLAISLFLPFLLLMWGIMTDSNLPFYKEVVKLLMIIGALMILMAFTRSETEETEQIRVKAMRLAVFLTVLFIFGGMLYRLSIGNAETSDGTTFLIFLIINVICLEFMVKKAKLDKIFKR